MKIKIPPYPDKIITDEAFVRDVEPITKPAPEDHALSDEHMIMFLLHPDGTKTFNRTRPIQVGDRKYISPFPNPLHLYLDLSIEHFEISEKIKQVNFMQCGKQYAKEVFLLDAEPRCTHDCFNKYFKYRMGSIIFLVSGLEAFMNHAIPDDFKYTRKKNGQLEVLSKPEIESTRVPFKEKLTTVVPEAVGRTEFWENKEPMQDQILSLYACRRELIHLKTNGKEALEKYYDQIDEMLDHDIQSSIKSSIQFMNGVIPDFVQVIEN